MFPGSLVLKGEGPETLNCVTCETSELNVGAGRMNKLRVIAL